MAIFSLALLGTGFLQTGLTKRITGLGGVSGMVTDDLNQPIKAQIFVVGKDLHVIASPSGRFEIEGIPAGDNSLVVVYQDTSLEYPVTVNRGKCTDIGQILLSVNQSPMQMKKP